MEFGSEFSLDVSWGNGTSIQDYFLRRIENFYYFQYTQSGRDAITVALSLLPAHVKTIYVPSYICLSVIHCFKNLIIKPYSVDKNFQCVLNTMDEEATEFAVYINNYFGLTNENYLFELTDKIRKQKNIYVIYDITHAIFNCNLWKDKKWDFCIASLRKWLPIPDGGIVFARGKFHIDLNTNNHKFLSTKLQAMILKNLYINGLSDDNINKKYRYFYTEAENLLDQQENKIEFVNSISDVSKALLSIYSLDNLIINRRKNFLHLNKYMSNKWITPIFTNLDSNAVPLVYPIYSPYRDILKAYLIENKIYCAIHWPLLNHVASIYSNETAQHILSVPIDQRYGKGDMNKLVEILNLFNGDINV